MAITKILPTGNRATASYHRIVKFEGDINGLNLTIAMYADSQARDLNLPLWHENVMIPAAQFDTNVVAVAYTLLTSFKGSKFVNAPGDVPPPANPNIELLEEFQAAPGYEYEEPV